MIQGIKIINYQNDEEESLYIDMFDPSETGIYIKSIEGLGTPPASIETSKIVNYDPSEYENTAVNPRNIVFTFGITNDYIVEKVRQRIYRYFVQGMPIKMVFITDVIGSVYINGITETVTPDIFSDMETVQASVICPDPYFYTGGKVMVDSSDKTGLFNFTTWWESNVKNGEIDGIEKPVSVMNESDTEGNIPIGLIYKSRVRNPKGFEIEITQKDDEFQEVFLEYNGGSIQINKSKSPSSQITDNFFKNVSLIIKNDINDINVYKKNLDTGTLTSILDMVYLSGNFPSLSSNINSFLLRIYGLYEISVMEKGYFYYDKLNGDYGNVTTSLDFIGNNNITVGNINNENVQMNLFNIIGNSGVKINDFGDRVHITGPNAFKFEYRIYYENVDNYIGTINVFHENCIYNNYNIINKKEYDSGFIPVTYSDELDPVNPLLYKTFSIVNDAELKFISSENYALSIDDVFTENLTINNQNAILTNTMYDLSNGDARELNINSNYGIIYNCFEICKIDKENKMKYVPRNQVYTEDGAPVPGSEVQKPWNIMSFNQVSTKNIFEFDDCTYLIRIIYNKNKFTTNDVDRTNGTLKNGIPLSITITDLTIPKKQFLEYLYLHFSNEIELSTDEAIRNDISAKYVGRYPGTAYSKVEKKNNPNTDFGTIIQYGQTYDGKITLSYDDRYDAI